MSFSKMEFDNTAQVIGNRMRKRTKDPVLVLQDAVQRLLQYEAATNHGTYGWGFLKTQHFIEVCTKRSASVGAQWKRQGESLGIPLGKDQFQQDRFLLIDGTLVEAVMSHTGYIENMQYEFDGFYAPARGVFGEPDERILHEVLTDLFVARGIMITKLPVPS